MTEPAQRGTMPFREHLVELRGRMLRAAAALALGFFVAWSFHVELYDWLSAPVRSAMADNGLFAIKALQITESISVYMKLSLVGGLFLVSPYVFYQIWAFIMPGLLATERRMMTPVILASATFFVAGGMFCYAVVLPFMTNFLIQLTIEAAGMTLEPTLQSTVSYSMWLLLAFGVIFELPVFMYFLSALGLVNAAGMWAFYRYWIVVAFIIGAVLTPTPDPLNQALMSGPLVILYGIGIGIAWLVERDRSEQRTGLPIRGGLVLLVVLFAAGAFASGSLGDKTGRAPVADVPKAVNQLVGVHRASWPKLSQQFAASTARPPLGILRLLKTINSGELKGQTIWLARFSDSAAVIVGHTDAVAVVKRVAASRKVSLVPYAGGQSALFALPGDREHWRVCAPQPDVLWLGHDRALARLARVREGRDAALVSDQRVAEELEPLRSSGPLFALALASEGRKGWLPDGALSEKVNLVTAYIDGPRKLLRLTYHSKGFETATALHDRLQVWTAEERQRAAQKPAGTQELSQLVGRLSNLSRAVARLAAVSARLMPEDSADHRTALRVSREALVVSRELGGVKPLKREPVSALDQLAFPPAISEIVVDRATVTWQVEAKPSTLVAGLLAPSDAGFDPAQLKAANKPKRPKPAPPKADPPKRKDKAQPVTRPPL